MKATFALLANNDIHNRIRKLTWDIHMKYQTGTLPSRLPPHISLKQPFQISNLAALSDYMDNLAGGILPFEVLLTEIQLVTSVYEGTPVGILWLDVRESKILRQIHTQLNQELEEKFRNTQAVHDGPDYHFHMTVAMGGQPVEVYRNIYQELEDKPSNLRFTAHELAMFVYDEPMGPMGDFITYKIVPLGG